MLPDDYTCEGQISLEEWLTDKSSTTEEKPENEPQAKPERQYKECCLTCKNCNRTKAKVVDNKLHYGCNGSNEYTGAVDRIGLSTMNYRCMEYERGSTKPVHRTRN